MRLIDADKIPWTDLNADMPNSKIKVLVTFADKVNRMPTIEKRNGMWRTAYLSHEYMGCAPMAYYCSECNHITTFRTFYCPNCGADMRGDTDE